MPLFIYKAQNEKGIIIEDSIAASSEKEAESLINDKKLKILYLKRQQEEKTAFLNLFEGNFPIQEKISLCKYLSLLMTAGLPLGESFDLLIKESKNNVVKRVLQDIMTSLNQGVSLYACFSKHKKYFDNVFLSMIKTGETSGTLNKSFDYLAKQFKQENSLKQKVVGALIYPLVIVVLMGSEGLGMLIFVMPKLAKSFLQMKLDLPFYTKLLFQVSLIAEKNILLILAGIAAVITLLILFFKSSFGGKIINKSITSLPIAKDIFLHYNLARFTQSLSSLIKAGVPIIESLEISSNTLGNSKNRNLAKTFRDKVSQGMPLATIFSEEKIFPPFVTQMVAIGEKSGNMDNVLSDMSTFYQEELENSLKNFISVLEPVLMIFIGVAVGLMAVSVISPIYSLIGKIQPK